MPLVLSKLQKNMSAIRAVLGRVEAMTTITRIHLHSSAPVGSVSTKPPNPATPAPREAPSFGIVDEVRLLQNFVDEVLAQGVWTTRTRRLLGQELVETRPSTRLAVTAALFFFFFLIPFPCALGYRTLCSTSL
ncbi:hypothetical protein H4582DRAFT_337246 [Lactarius indigo]|nr:hypothetical protein H4582DRAFT_337246 [Lactarius indigo]